MWALVNRTAYAAERTWVRDRDGHHLWIVVVKACFELDDHGGALRLADEQPAPGRLPVYFGEPGASSLRNDVELVAPKPTTDVLLNAVAVAPGSRATTSVEVALRVDTVEKSLRVFGEREYTRTVQGLGLSSPRPFLRHPIVYEWAYGGTDLSSENPAEQRVDLRNPVGRGVCRRTSTLVGKPAHRIEYPQGQAARAGPAGFGALASHWSPRLELAGTFDAEWERSRRPLLPRDYDESAVLCAPADQRPPSHLRGGELVELRNMSPRGVLCCTLPTLRFEFVTLFGARREEHGTDDMNQHRQSPRVWDYGSGLIRTLR